MIVVFVVLFNVGGLWVPSFVPANYLVLFFSSLFCCSFFCFIHVSFVLDLCVCCYCVVSLACLLCFCFCVFVVLMLCVFVFARFRKTT